MAPGGGGGGAPSWSAKFSQQRRGNKHKTPSSAATRTGGKKRRRPGHGRRGGAGTAGAADLENKVSRRGGRSGYLLNDGGGGDGGDDENADPRLTGGAGATGKKSAGKNQQPPRVRQFASSTAAVAAAAAATPAPARASAAANPYKTPAVSSSSASGRKKYSARGTPYSIGTMSSRFTLSSSSSRTPFERTYGSSATPASSAASTSESGGVHVVCAISENLARETCLACIDAGLPVELRITKQGNGNTYGETLACLEWLKPDEILLNEGRRTSQLAIKVLSLYNQRGDDDGANSVVAGGGGNGDDETANDDDRSTATRTRRAAAGASDAPPSNTVVKFLPRHYFDQTRGAELLRRVCRRETQRDSSVTEEYILLASSHAALHYSAHCLGATFSNHSVALAVNSSSNCNRMMIDRGTLMQLELLANAKTGASKHSLIGTVDCTKTTLGSRLLRRTIMAPPVRLSTIEARLDLVDSLLADEEFFYAVMEHLEAMPGLDKMMSHMALVPKVSAAAPSEGGRRRGGKKKDALAQAESGGAGGGGGGVVTERMAARGIEALICIKSTLSVLPSFAAVVADQLKVMEARDAHRRRKEREEAGVGMDVEEDDDDDASASSDEGEDDDDDDDDDSSLGSSSSAASDDYDDSLIADDDGTVTTGHFTFMGELTLTSSPYTEGKPNAKKKRKRKKKKGKGKRKRTRHPPNSLLLRAILHTMRQPALDEILGAVREIFTESTTYSKNSHAMRHQECFALKPNTDGMMDILRKAFLANVDDIYRLADEYSERYGVTVAVRETTSRGYYLSIPATFAPDLPPAFIQPVKTGRFIHCTTEEVHSLNARARENVQDLLLMTHGRIQEVIDVARVRFDALASLCDAIALLDMTHCFADNVATSRLPWCRPVVTDSQVVGGADAGGGAGAGQAGDDGGRARGGGGPAGEAAGPLAGGGGAMAIRNGRYAIDVSGSAGGQAGTEFVPNDTYAAAYQNFTIITGVNGSGKSTYLKQIAIIVILAHCGSYVPAEEAFVPIRDRLLTRIGTSDDQEHNISTFMLEMKETASVCNQATDKSLILIDELGRATSNEDGVAIAWAVSEFLLVKRAMTFFVTHYPQLSRLADVYPNVQNQHLGTTTVRSSGGDELQYTHKILPGPCEMAADYGVEMAGTCGWPIDVVRDARSLRVEVEKRLPDGALCQRNSGPNVELLEVRVKAEGILTDIAKYLVALKEGRLSREAQRSYLQDIRDRLIPSQDSDIVEMIKTLLLADDQRVSRTLQDEAAAASLSTKKKPGETPEAAKGSLKRGVLHLEDAQVAQEERPASSSARDGAASSQNALLSDAELPQPAMATADMMEESSECSSDSDDSSSSEEDDDSCDGDESESHSKGMRQSNLDASEDSSSCVSGSDDGSESDSSEGGSCDIDDSSSETEK